MTKSEAKKKLREAQHLIFQVEEGISKTTDDPIRKMGYGVRIRVGDFENVINSNLDDADISIRQK